MIRSIPALLLVTLFCFLTVGCGTAENGNVTQNASQQDIDDYNALIKQAEDEMSGDADMEKFKD